MKAELLAPAGDYETACVALGAGADAIYLGLSRFSARQSAGNFSEEDLKAIVLRAHLLGAKVYVALNTLVKESETAAFFSEALRAWNCGADALLIQDIFLGRKLKETYPEMTLHLSTQGGCCNVHGAKLAKEYGFSRVVLARETPLSDIAAISEIVETEAFVQGALCACFSGQCYLSSFAGNNSGNRGRCKQPCRKLYSIDRDGFEDEAYALSPADLSLGKDVFALLDRGVSSLKIEGRMRRGEYVGAAVKYYRAILAGREGKEELSDLKRAYNRGDYTRGLAFGQEKFLSRNVQGHIGERVGKIELSGNVPFCMGKAEKGDAFKILRGGKEVGGAVFREKVERGFTLSSTFPLKAGDEVRITTDTNAAKRSLTPIKLRPVSVFVRVKAGEKLYACSEGVSFEGGMVAPAKNAPLSEEEIKNCFLRTDGLPFKVHVEAETANAFVPKSGLNAFRRAFYEALVSALSSAREQLPEREISRPALFKSNEKGCAEMGETQQKDGIFIYKPRDYSALPTDKKDAFLYLPPLFTQADEALVAPHFKDFRGIYAEGYYGLALAEKYGLELFAGTGFNLTNSFAVEGVKKGAKYFALSKELNKEEQAELAAKGSFALAEGSIKVMDLGFCPFEKSCKTCDRRGLYTLKDGENRTFPLRRYSFNGCRFEVYNCAPLKGEGGASPIFDTTPLGQELSPRTKGHAERSML